MADRVAGPYWVRHGDRWVIGFWNEELWWYLDDGNLDQAPDEIGERVERLNIRTLNAALYQIYRSLAEITHHLRLPPDVKP